MANLNIHISDKANAFASEEAAKLGLTDAAAFAASLLEETAEKNGHRGPSTRFHDEGTNLDALVRSQGVKPIKDVSELVADFWPRDESADDMIAALRDRKKAPPSSDPDR